MNEINIYIQYSTFKDMQAERDYLHEKVFSRLRKLVGQYGEDVQELDLRWGVDTYQMNEAESGYQVLRVCIDAIDRCKPYIIVLLGERYGWIPDERLVESLQDERLKRHYEAAMSITNLEIRYGALSEEETLERCIFCFRNADFIEQIPEEQRGIYLGESREHKEKLKILKEQIRSRKHAKILDYRVQWDEKAQAVTGLEDWGEELYQLLKALLQKEFAGKEAAHPVERYILDARCTRERYLASYTPRLYEETQAVDGFWFMAADKSELYYKDRSAGQLNYAYGKEQCMHFSGEAGCGKSALIAALSQEVEGVGAEAVLYFCGNPGCQNPDVLKSVLIYRLEEILELPHVFEPENSGQYLRTLDEKAKKIPIYCFVDALDQLFPNYERAYLEILDLCPNLFVITSALMEFPYEKALLRARKIRFIQVRRFTNVDKRNLIQKTSAYRGKKIDDFLERRICEKTGSGNPLFLSLLLQRLFAMRREEFEQAERLVPGMDGLHQYMLELIEKSPETAKEEALQIFERVSQMFDSAFFQKVAALIAMSKTGLTERELAKMLEGLNAEFSQLKFQEILYYLYDVFTEKEDGRFIFSHRIFYEAVQKSMGREEAVLRRCLIDYSMADPEFMEREGYYHILKSRDELGKTVLIHCGTWANALEVRELAVKLLSEDEEAEGYFRNMMKGGDVEKLFAFWQGAIGASGSKKAQMFRQSICERIAENDSLDAEIRAEALRELWNWGAEESKQLFYTNEVALLIPKMKEPDRRNYWELKKSHMEAWNLLDGGRYEEAAEQEILDIQAEFSYIQARISLKRKEVEQARRYMEFLGEIGKKREHDPWMSGQLLLLAGDVLSAERKYKDARAVYSQAVSYWGEQQRGVEENLRRLLGFEIKDGTAKRGLAERKWHVKTFFYHIYGVWQRAELFEAGMKECCQDYKKVFLLCIGKVFDEEYLPAAQDYMLRAMDRLLRLMDGSGWKDEDVFEMLGRTISYCKGKGMETEWIMKAVSDALARCDLCGMMNKEFWKADLRTQICFYLKERTDLENGILPCNKFGIGRVWLRLGCYEEAWVWLEQIPKEEACYGEARVWLLFAKAMVMLFRKDREPLEKIKAELEMIYQEKEDAQRSLCILKGIVDQESYFTLEQRQREYFFKKLHEVWKAYAEGNKKQPKGKEAAVIWEEQAADMRRLAKGGMTWQIDKNAVAEFIFTLCHRLYEAAEGEEEKGEVSQKTWTFWQEYYQDIPVEDLSTENLYMLWHLGINLTVFCFRSWKESFAAEPEIRLFCKRLWRKRRNPVREPLRLKRYLKDC